MTNKQLNKKLTSRMSVDQELMEVYTCVIVEWGPAHCKTTKI